MDRYEHLLIEFYWSAPTGVDPVLFKPSFVVFHPDGHTANHVGANAEIAVLMTRLGGEGWRVSSSITASNWIVWTMERKKQA